MINKINIKEREYKIRMNIKAIIGYMIGIIYINYMLNSIINYNIINNIIYFSIKNHMIFIANYYINNMRYRSIGLIINIIANIVYIINIFFLILYIPIIIILIIKTKSIIIDRYIENMFISYKLITRSEYDDRYEYNNFRYYKRYLYKI